MTDTIIASVVGRRVWDSRGRPTVEAEVLLADGSRGRAIAPSGVVQGPGEAVDLRDGGSVLDGLDVRKAVGHVNGDVALVLKGLDAADQALVDDRLEELDGTADFQRIGANAAIAVSLATLQAVAASRRMPLWRLLQTEAGLTGEVPLPLPQAQIFAGGARAGRRIDLQEIMLACPGADSFAQALDWIATVYHSAGKIMAAAGRLAGTAEQGGWWPMFDGNDQALDAMMEAIELAGLEPGVQVAIALGVAADRLRRHDGLYHLDCDGRTLDSEGMIATLGAWVEHYPIVALVDPLAADDIGGLAAITGGLGDRVRVIAAAAAQANAVYVARLAATGACNCLLIKPSRAGTVTRARQALDAARIAGWETGVATRSGDSEDTGLVHLAVGWGVGLLQAGAFARSERMAKWNEALRIEEALGSQGRLAHPYAS